MCKAFSTIVKSNLYRPICTLCTCIVISKDMWKRLKFMSKATPNYFSGLRNRFTDFSSFFHSQQNNKLKYIFIHRSYFYYQIKSNNKIKIKNFIRCSIFDHMFFDRIYKLRLLRRTNATVVCKECIVYLVYALLNFS